MKREEGIDPSIPKGERSICNHKRSTHSNQAITTKFSFVLPHPNQQIEREGSRVKGFGSSHSLSFMSPFGSTHERKNIDRGRSNRHGSSISLLQCMYLFFFFGIKNRKLQHEKVLSIATCESQGPFLCLVRIKLHVKETNFRLLSLTLTFFCLDQKFLLLN